MIFCSLKILPLNTCSRMFIGWILMSRNWFGNIWIRNVGDIDFEAICAAENSNKFQKTRLRKEKAVENVAALKAYHSIQARFPFIFGCSKNPYRHCKTMFTCWVSLFCNGFTLEATAQVTLVLMNRDGSSSYQFQAWFPFIFGSSKKSMHTLQDNVHMLSIPIL